MNVAGVVIAKLHEKRMNSMNIAYHIRPRFTPGSPAQIDRVQAVRLSQDEVVAYGDALTDSTHHKHQQAREQGLAWVMWVSWESHGKYHRRCLLTGATLQQNLKDPIVDPPLGDKK